MTNYVCISLFIQNDWFMSGSNIDDATTERKWTDWVSHSLWLCAISNGTEWIKRNYNQTVNETESLALSEWVWNGNRMDWAACGVARCAWFIAWFWLLTLVWSQANKKEILEIK